MDVFAIVQFSADVDLFPTSSETTSEILQNRNELKFYSLNILIVKEPPTMTG